MGTPNESVDFTSLMKSEEADILEINDSVAFRGQKNVCTFTAEKTGNHVFALENIDDSVSAHKFDFNLKQEETLIGNGIAG